MKYEPVIGLEVHVELKTNSKMFCGCNASHFGVSPNTHCCPTCLGLPGALPVPNKKALEWCIKIGLALNCKIPLFSKFDRKNYFYPDLPKGYQISQYDMPLCQNGNIIIEGKEIEIERVHMEEDTGKLQHTIINNQKYTLIDFNRSGVPLVEIVTKPCIHSAMDAKKYLQNLKLVIQYLGVSDCDMEKGTMRLEPNISLQKIGSKTLPLYKVEIKNINSFKFVEKAINFEIERQEEILEKGEEIKQQTRGWDEKKEITILQRIKEEAKDYRYFPEPDIPPMIWNVEEIEKIKKTIKTPDEEITNYKKFNLSDYEAKILVEDRKKGNLLKRIILETYKQNNKDAKIPDIIINFNIAEAIEKLSKENKEIIKGSANLIINEKVDLEKNTPQQIINIIKTSKTGIISNKEELLKIINAVLKENSQAVLDFQKGKQQSFGFLMGMLMKKTKGKADPVLTKRLLLEKLQKVT